MKKYFSIVYNNKYLLSFICLTIISIVEFKSYLSEEMFYRYKFDFDKIETLKDFGKVNVYKADHKTIKLQPKSNLTLQSKKYYSISFDENKREHFFSFHSLRLNDTLTLDYVVWLFKKPLQTQGEAKIKEVFINREEQGEVRVGMFVEQLGCCLMNGKKMRFYWNKINRDLHFKGTSKDVYGYSFYGGEDFKSSGFLDVVKDVKDLDVLVLWTGRNETNLLNNQTIKNISKFINQAKVNNPNSKIVLMYPAPSPNEEYDDKIYKLILKMQNQKWNDVITVDTYSLIKSKTNWESTMFYKDYALTDKAYQLIVKHLNEKVFGE